MIYTEYPPPADLAPWVACFWRIAGRASDDAPVRHRVLPDGCADVLFDLSGGGSPELIGPMTAAHVVELCGSVDVLGVRLRPGAMAAFAGARADELLDAAVPMSVGVSVEQLAEVAAVSTLPAVSASPRVYAVAPSRVSARDVAAQLSLLVGTLRAHVADLERPDAVVGHALKRWVRAELPDFPSVSVLTRDLGLSERAFERRFVANVGLTPVGYRRLARLRTVLRLHAQGARGWASIAAATGFSDQAHLVRDCRAFTGLTPTEWAASQVASVGFFQDGAVTTI